MKDIVGFSPANQTQFLNGAFMFENADESLKQKAMLALRSKSDEKYDQFPEQTSILALPAAELEAQ